MNHRLGRMILIAVWLGTGMMMVSCDSPPSPEEQAQTIFDEALKTWKEGKDLEAFREFDRLVDFKGTPAYQEAEKKLAAEGVSIGAAVKIWTAKKMFQVKNDLINSGRDEAPKPGLVTRLPEKDGWDSFFQLEYPEGQNFKFQIRSYGPDKTPATEDDMVLLHGTASKEPVATPEPEPEEQTPVQKKFLDSEAKDLRVSPRPETPAGSPGRRAGPEQKESPLPQGVPTQKGPTGEPTVDLNDLLSK